MSLIRTLAEHHDAGAAPEGIDRAVALVRERGAIAQLTVLRHGRVIVDEAVGCSPDSLFWVFSTSKPLVTVLLLQAVEAGLVELDAPVADYWPEFAQHGKGAITVRDVLQHRTGFATTGSPAADALAMGDWESMLRRIEHVRPHRAPGERPAYQWLAYGFMLGEIVQRVTGRDIAELMRERIFEPLAMHDSHLGLPTAEAHRAVRVRAPGLGGRLVERMVNRPATRSAVIPSAGVSTTSRDLAAFYLNLLGGGDAAPLLRPETLAAALTLSSEGVKDRFARSPIRWANGFQLGGDRGVPGAIQPMGSLSSPTAFGHNGSNCCMTWADPDRGIVFSYLTNTLPPSRDRFGHLVAVADAVLAACDAADASASP